ncbi:sentrin-specific protease 1-like isoform X2 [Galleria mellonella]|uniref:Sentrin-specific protease 1-like isoform X2 n=1 Tax=Galleria mellonella TaxID=7137 RepID=A0ABM3N4Z0_GALME|nr:sentrin-specific protease 1-like isoform X2 [Galleria mellonella]
MFRIPLKVASRFWKAEDDFSSDDDTPALKKLRQMRKTSFPDIMADNDFWDHEKSKVRYVPIQIERGHPSTSTPNRVLEKPSKVRTVPIKLVGVKENGAPTSYRKVSVNRPVIHAVVDDEDDCDDQEVTWVDSKSGKPKVYIDLDEEESDHNQRDDDVIFVKKVTSPPPVKPYKYFIANSGHEPDSAAHEPVYYKLSRNLNDRNANISPRAHSKFKAPAGISKPYRKAPTPVPKWMQTCKSSNLPNLRNRYLNINGNTRSTLSEVFNLDEKRNYQELIRRVAGTKKPMTFGKPVDIISIAEDAASFRLTQKSQKKALDEIKLVEKGLSAEKENEVTKEYDPITVASINSSDSEVEIVPSESSTSSLRIDPINSLRESFKDRAVISSDWLSKLDSKYKKKKQQTQEKLIDARRESDIIAKVNNEQKIAHLENKLKYELSIPESLFEEPQPTVELPALTPEQEKLVNRALGPGPPGQVLVEKFNLRIHRRDLQTLSGLNWLNDEVINFYMNLLMQRSEDRKDLPKVYATNTFFYPKLMQSGQAGLRRWTRKVDIFAHDLMVVPVHLGVHWCLSLVDFQNKKISYLDSMGSSNQACLDALMQYLRDEHQDKKGQPFDDKGWKAECLKNIPQQMNGSDCGMFACTFAEFAARGAPYTFTQAHMPYLRRKAALEILGARLLL